LCLAVIERKLACVTISSCFHLKVLSNEN
jgi:hypothetical protein